MIMHVAVVIVGYRNCDDILRCLAGLAQSRHREFEVVIVENGGPDSFADLSARAPAELASGQRVQLVAAPGNLGYAGGINVALGRTPGADAWWILNPDTIPQPGALVALVARLASGDCDAVGGILYGSDERIQTAGGRWRAWLARAEALGRGRPIADPPPVPETEAQLGFLSGASLLVGRRWLETVGPLREDYFLYAEEVEWCLRGHALGMRLGFAPDALVLHDQGSSTGSARAVRDRPRLPVYLDERNRMLVTRDCFPLRLAIAAPAALVLIALRFLRRGAWRQFGYALAGWRDGLLGRRGVPAWM